MTDIYIDAGTTWTKILEVKGDKKTYKTIKSGKLKDLYSDCKKATGHTSIKTEKYVNEAVALAMGAKKYLEKDCTVLDLGSRDIKWVKYQNGKFKDMDWNTACASATGATVEMLLKFYGLKTEDLEFTKEKYTITCGIFGLEKIMDDVSHGLKASVAVSKFVHGLAYNAFIFTKKSENICISGGFCENRCFMESLKQYANIIPLGRYVLVDGLLNENQ